MRTHVLSAAPLAAIVMGTGVAATTLATDVVTRANKTGEAAGEARAS